MQLGQRPLPPARQVMDWCPMLLTGVCARFVCKRRVAGAKLPPAQRSLPDSVAWVHQITIHTCRLHLTTTTIAQPSISVCHGARTAAHRWLGASRAPPPIGPIPLHGNLVVRRPKRGTGA